MLDIYWWLSASALDWKDSSPSFESGVVHNAHCIVVIGRGWGRAHLTVLYCKNNQENYIVMGAEWK